MSHLEIKKEKLGFGTNNAEHIAYLEHNPYENSPRKSWKGIEYFCLKI